LATRSSDAEIEYRIQHLTNLRIQGYSYTDIADHCKAKWGISSSRTISKYMMVVSERLAKENDAELEERRAEQIARYKDIIKRLYPKLYRKVQVVDATGKPKVDKKGRPVYEKEEDVSENAMRLYIMTCRRLDRISGTESITHKFEGLINFKTADINLTDKDEKEYASKLEAFFGGKAPKN
jgi:hypothetical protein